MFSALAGGMDAYNDDDEGDKDDGNGLDEHQHAPLRSGGDSESKAAMEAASVIRRLREQQQQGYLPQPMDSPNKRLDALAGE